MPWPPNLTMPSVYFDSRSIANVSSLYHLGQKFKVTYNSTDRCGVFKVFTKAGVFEFAPTTKGLHAINIQDNPDAAYILVNNVNLSFASPIQTVCKNYKGNTKKHLTTIEHFPQHTASKLGSLLHCIINVYTCASFTVQTILVDNEFEKVKDHIHQATLNTTAASEHVGDIKHHIWVIKECCRGIICTLPYAHFPQIMLVHLLHHVIMWLNNFPVKNGVSNHFSPLEIVLCHKLDFKHHCRAPFGAYCKVHKDNSPTNSIKSCGIPSICFGPTGNIQGIYIFLNLATGLVIRQQCFNKLPAPDSIIVIGHGLLAGNILTKGHDLLD
jgi:hypothetical protein